MPLSATTKKLIGKVIAQRKPLLITGGTEAERLALARQIYRLLPPLTKTEKSELFRIHKLAGLEPINARPFRAPHHTISDAGLCGGKTVAMSGEAELAHSGVLFLDHVTEFKEKALQRLKKILETGECACSEDGRTAQLPVKLLLIAGTELSSEKHGQVTQLGFAETVEL